MTPEVFAEWLRRQGHRVVRTTSSYWFNRGPRVFQAFPYHWVIEPDEEELHSLFRDEGAVGLRYSTPLSAAEGICSYHMVYERPTYDLKDVDASVRSKVRRGLEACQVGPISLERYAEEGWAIEQDTLARQQRHSRLGRERWDRMIQAAEGLEGFEAWGAEVQGRLGATLLFARQDASINMLYQQSLHEYLPFRVNNALLFAVTKAVVARPGVGSIHNGLHSLDAPGSVDLFKARLGYTAKPVRQRVVFHPRLAPLVAPVTGRALHWLAALCPRNEYVRKAEGLTRFYLQGQLPLARQPFPELLEADREALCGQLEPAPAPGREGPTLQGHEGPTLQGQPVRIRPAGLADLPALTALHLACFTEQEHVALALGRPFLDAVYRWFVTSPETQVLLAWQGKHLIGFTALSRRPYNLPMLRACTWAGLAGVLRRPRLLFRRDWLARLGTLLLRRGEGGEASVAQIAFTGLAQEARGHGIGRALKEASIQVCRGWGVDAVITGVHWENLRARRLNERMGFVEVPDLSSSRLAHLRLELKAPCPQPVPPGAGVPSPEMTPELPQELPFLPSPRPGSPGHA
ncbi:MAG TPA: GNAT family N-acetyltransferase [Geothrix sp.]|nr:GNAT family N-acetyltransferase [Geothrix sp.]